MVNYALTAIPVILVAALTLLGIRRSDNSSKSFMDLDYTTAIKGIACIIILYVHISSDKSNVLQNAIGSFAYIGVFSFFMISAYGLCFSVERNSNYLKAFWGRRLLKLFVPAIILNVVNFSLNYLILNKVLLNKLYTMNKYIYAIIFAYFVFWIVSLAVKNQIKRDVIICLICGLASLVTFFSNTVKPFWIWESESIGFIFGIILYHNKEKLISWFSKMQLFKLVCLSLFSLSMGLLYLKFKGIAFWGDYVIRIVLAVVVLMTAFCVSYNLRFTNRLLLLLGGISYSVYLGHLFVINILNEKLSCSSGVFIIIVVLVTLVIAYIVEQISKRCISIISMRTKRRKENG